jgi:gluconate 2-dehydrogenase gamma chain
MSVSRRRFLQLLGALGVSQAVNIERGQDASGGALPLAPEYNPPPQPRILGNRFVAYTFFTAPEARFIESVVARLIPADDLGPGALEAGVAYFIDQQLQGAYGLAAKMYMQGPWGPVEGSAEASDELQNEVSSTEEQGYQLPVTPQELYQLCIAALETYAEETNGALFATMTATQQDEMLTALEEGNITVEPLPAPFLSTFWTMLLANTKQGFFADPAYGGNADKVGWRLVGFPGVAAAYKGVIQAYYNVPYLVDPVSLVDIQNGTIAMDATGHALHMSATTGEIIKGTGHEH